MLKCYATTTTNDSWLRLTLLMWFFFSRSLDFYENEPTKCEHYERQALAGWSSFIRHSVCECVSWCVCMCVVSKWARLFWRHPFLVHTHFFFRCGRVSVSWLRSRKGIFLNYRFVCTKYKHVHVIAYGIGMELTHAGKPQQQRAHDAEHYEQYKGRFML